MSSTQVFKALSWTFQNDPDSDQCFFYVSGISTDDSEGSSRSVQLRVQGFHPFCFVELPGEFSHWAKRIENFVKYILGHCYKERSSDDDGPQRKWKKFGEPLQCKLTSKLDIHGSVPKTYLYLEFLNSNHTRNFADWITSGHRGIKLDGIHSIPFKKGYFKCSEHNIDPIIHLRYDRQIDLAGWIEAKKCLVIDQDYYGCEYQDLYPSLENKGKYIPPKYLSFDFETYSKNHKAKMPDPKRHQNVIFHIGVVVGRMGCHPDQRKYVLFSLGKPLECSEVEPLSKKGYARQRDYRKQVEVIRFEEEEDMLLAFKEFIQAENPDIITGYNILKFDQCYFLHRNQHLGIEDKMQDMSRFPTDLPSKKTTLKWSSSAYGEQEAEYQSFPGRVIVDLILEIQRNHRLASYSLDSVSEHFLKERKEDVTPMQLFAIWRLYKKSECKPLSEIQARLDDLMPEGKLSDFLLDYKRKIAKAKTIKKVRRYAQELITMTGYYCIIDTVLPIDLMEKLNTDANMEALSNIMGVPRSYLHTRGQQIKVVSMVYATAKPLNYVVHCNEREKDNLEPEKKKYQGAVVIDAVPGMYSDVDLADFESLYPTEVISNNICWSTFLFPDNPEHEAVPDSMAHVMEWERHEFCEHDPSGKKTAKKEKIICEKFRYRFRKAQYTAKDDGGFDVVGEGILPLLERRLLAERKVWKRELARMQARLAMHTGKATPEDISYYTGLGYEIIEKNSLDSRQESDLRIRIVVCDSFQLGVKTSCNSVYGVLGVRKNGMIPFPEGAACVTFMGREHLIMSRNYVVNDFSARIIYGDTDSLMFNFPSSTKTFTKEHPFDRADRIVKAVTHYLKCKMLGLDHTQGIPDKGTLERFKYDFLPINLQREHNFKKLLLLSKKRYIAHIQNRDGKVVGKVKKGNVEARREFCFFIKKLYAKVTDSIFEENMMTTVADIVVDGLKALVLRQYTETDLVIHQSIGKFEKYASKEKGPDQRILSLKYSSDGKVVPGPGNPTSSPDPLDWHYPISRANLALALKMLRRGDKVPPNTRLEYVFLKLDSEIPGKSAKQTEKVEDYIYYTENKSSLRLDVAYYIEHQMSKPLSEVLFLAFGKEKVVRRTLNDEKEETKELLESFTKLPRPLSTIIGAKRGVVAKIRYFMENYQNHKECSLFLGKVKQDPIEKDHRQPKLLDEVNRTLEMCKVWQTRKRMEVYFSGYGVGKSALKRARKAKHHPLIIDVVQTMHRHQRVILHLNQLFGVTRR